MTVRRLAHFELLQLLGEGAMGRVYRAVDLELDRPVAIKLLSGRTLGDPTFAERFRREARLAAQLNHPHIATIYSFGEVDGEAYIAMEYVEGETLAEVLVRGPLSVEETRKVGRQTASALAVAHAKGIIHRDIKPGNLMFTPTGDIKVMDFGVARRSGETELTMAGSLIGTANIMAPELVQGGEATPAADLFSLGCVLYEILTGRPAFDGETAMAVLFQVVNAEPAPLERLRPDVPSDLRDIVQGLMSKDPAVRLGPAARVVQRLDADATGPTGSSIPAIPGEAMGTMVLSPAGGALAPPRPDLSGATPPPEVKPGGLRPRRRGAIPGAIAVLGLGAAAWWLLRPGAPDARKLAEQANVQAEALLERSEANDVTPDGALALQDSALTLFLAALHSDSTFAPAWNNLGLLYRRRDRDQAMAHLTRAAELDPNYALPRYNLGLIALENQDPRAAEEHFTAAIRVDPTYAEAHWGMARAREATGDTAGAIRSYREATAAAPDFVLAYNDLGFLYLEAGKPESTRVVLEPVASRFERPALWKNLGEAYRKLARYDDAERAYQQALGLQGEYAPALMGLARTAEARGDREAARSYWSKLLANPDSSTAMQARGALERLGFAPR